MRRCLLILLICFTMADTGIAQIGTAHLAISPVGSFNFTRDSIGIAQLNKCSPQNFSCTDANYYFHFTGNGDWELVTNWENEMMPPVMLEHNTYILIDAIQGGECILNHTQTLPSNATFEIADGKRFRANADMLFEKD